MRKHPKMLRYIHMTDRPVTEIWHKQKGVGAQSKDRTHDLLRRSSELYRMSYLALPFNEQCYSKIIMITGEKAATWEPFYLILKLEKLQGISQTFA